MIMNTRNWSHNFEVVDIVSRLQIQRPVFFAQNNQQLINRVRRRSKNADSSILMLLPRKFQNADDIYNCQSVTEFQKK